MSNELKQCPVCFRPAGNPFKIGNGAEIFHLCSHPIHNPFLTEEEQAWKGHERAKMAAYKKRFKKGRV